METSISLVLAAVPVVLAGTCSKGWETAKGPLCIGGSYDECIAHEVARCLTQCKTSPFGFSKKCFTPCSELIRQKCSVWCASVGNCADCMKAFQVATATGNPEAGRKYCSKEGCKFSLNLVYASVQSLTVHFSGPLFLWLRSSKVIV